MSLILDALRKSEAERRRGQAPDLYAELPPLVSRATARRPAWPWWLAAGFALLATLWMLRDVQSGSGGLATPSGNVRTEIAASHASAPVARPAPTPVVIAPAAASTAAVVPARVTSTSSASTLSTTEAGQPAAGSLASAAPKPDLAQAAQAGVASAATPGASAPPSSIPASPLPAPEAASQPVLPPVASAAPAPTASAATPLPAAAAPVRLADLSAGEREQLPALKISMHMWGPAPAQRFAIIDGARVGQGDRVGDAVVEEIAADSVVLNWHGQRVALPIR
ncbi:MAG TPA: general secretion pathway protein GspB [Lysobacter sp.]